MRCIGSILYVFCYIALRDELNDKKYGSGKFFFMRQRSETLTFFMLISEKTEILNRTFTF